MEIGKIYHVMTKSIAGYVIFNNEEEYLRMRQLFQYYQVGEQSEKFSYFKARQKAKNGLVAKEDQQNKKKLIRIIAYCFMPTHIHLILQQLRSPAAASE